MATRTTAANPAYHDLGRYPRGPPTDRDELRAYRHYSAWLYSGTPTSWPIPQRALQSSGEVRRVPFAGPSQQRHLDVDNSVRPWLAYDSHPSPWA